MVVAALCFLLTDWGGFAPHNDTASTFSPCYGSASRSPPSSRRGIPRDFDVFFFWFFWPSGAFFLSSGLVGLPLPCFPLPPGPCGLSFFWVGGFPLPCFPGVSPMFLGRGGVVFCVFVSPAISCILRLFLSLATRAIWSTDPQTPRPPPPFSLVRRS